MYKFVVKSSIHDYEVCFIDDLKTSLKENILNGDFIIIDKKIVELYGNIINEIIYKYCLIFIDANEVQKSYEGIIPVIKQLIDNGFRKNNRLVAIGGGITQDVTAFISSVMYRGVDWNYFPTTLLSQSDSCIGSKTSINFGEYKNQIGGFYPPKKILIYPSFIESLSEKEIMSGMGEMLHYFIVSGEEDFKMYEIYYKDAFTNKKTLSILISRSLEIKKGYIEIDEYDRNIRQVFNYGHTFGHAIESLKQYTIPHGIAVCFGMDIANYLSVKMGFINNKIRDEINTVIKTITQCYSIKDMDIEQYLKALSKDKKNEGKKLGLILNKGYGNIFKNITEVDDKFIGWLKEYFQTELN